LIGPEGDQVGVVPIAKARSIAEEAGMDMVEVAPNAKPPVVRVMDYGKFRYELQKKEKQSRKRSQQSQIKRMRVTPKIEEHDFATKLKSVRQFLEQGDKVKITVIFKGRMVTHKEFGREVINKFIEATSDIAKPEGNVMMEGPRNMVVTLQKK
jgi:translation initiation factor IF-3